MSTKGHRTYHFQKREVKEITIICKKCELPATRKATTKRARYCISCASINEQRRKSEDSRKHRERRERRKKEPKPRKLIPYAGKDSSERGWVT